MENRRFRFYIFMLHILCSCFKYELTQYSPQLYQLNQKFAFHFIPQGLQNVLVLTLKDKFMYNILKTVWQQVRCDILDILNPQTSKTLRSSKGKIGITLLRFLLHMQGPQINFKTPTFQQVWTWMKAKEKAYLLIFTCKLNGEVTLTH